MKKIKILDCTLRDGGYVNDWNFGKSHIQAIISKLVEAGIDIIECGFLSQKKSSTEDNTIFRYIDELKTDLPTSATYQLALMINYGEYAIEDLPLYEPGNLIDTIRVAFHKKDLKEALGFCRQITLKGYHTYVQPMVTSNYSPQELQFLIDQSNEMMPKAVYMVDSFGTMRKNDILSLYKPLEEKLDAKIAIGFHSHNNLQLSFSNAQELIHIETERELIIDSSVFGMGRGAGNLCTELLTLYLNENTNNKYNIIPILEIIDDYLNPIFIKTPWGYSVPFYVASANKCHPNYASFLLNKETLGVKAINLILSQIPDSNKQLFDQKLIEQLYFAYQEYQIDDLASLQRLKDLIKQKEVLVISPGRTIETHQDEIHRFIKERSPFVISVNFIPTDYNPDIIFISNLKRFEIIIDLADFRRDRLIVATSNLVHSARQEYCFVNYSSLINMDFKEMDNAGMMILKLLQLLGKTKVSLAGYDGYTSNVSENYYSDEMIISQPSETLEDRNRSIAAQIHHFRKNMQIDFLTPSYYTILEKNEKL